jgi:hypothetical protein
MRLALGLTVLALSVAPSGAVPTLLRVSKLQIRDGAGTRVADISPDRALRGEVALRIGADDLVFVTLRRQQIDPETLVYFPTADCSGPPIFADDPDAFYRLGVIAGPRHTVYLPGGPVRTRNVRSAEWYGTCQRWPLFQERGPLGVRAVDLVDYFTPPFTLRAIAGEIVPRAAPETAAPGPLATAKTLGVYDSRGTKLADAGPDPDPSTTVAFLTGTGRILIVHVLPLRLRGTADLYFEGDNCTGRAFFSAPAGTNDLPALTALVGPRWTVYSEAGVATTATVRSHLADNTCFATFPGPITARPAARAGLDLADYFVAPFSVQPLGLSTVPPRSAAPAGEAEDAEE